MSGKYDTVFDEIMAKDNGYLHISRLESYGIDRTYVYPYIRERKLKKIARGMYCPSDMIPDMMFVVCRRNAAAIISHFSAAHYHGLIQDEPARVSVSVPQGYNAMHLTDRWVQVYQVKKDILLLGKTTIIDKSGNRISIYDKERTICDLIREREYEKHDGDDRTSESIRNYFSKYTDRDIQRLSDYSKAMGIQKKVKSYLTLFL